MADESVKAADGTQSAPAAKHDPMLLALIVLMIVVYAVGQWLTFSVLAAKLDAIEQRVNDGTSRTDTKVEALEDVALRATQVLKKGQQQAVVVRSVEPAAPPAASAAPAEAAAKPPAEAPKPAAEASKK
jgi:hypothetical protein